MFGHKMAVPGGGTAHFPVFYIRHKGLQNIHHMGAGSEIQYEDVRRSCPLKGKLKFLGGPEPL